MGYFGKNILENDQALDWLGELTARNVRGRIRKAFVRFIAWEPRDETVYSQDDIELRIGYAIAHDRKFLPGHRKVSGAEAESMVQAAAAEYRSYLESGRYLDERYGPAEEALAAAELVRQWITPDGSVSECEETAAILESLRRKQPESDLVDLATRAVDKALSSERYQRMRKFYLEAFPNMSGGDDSMAAVKELREDLERMRGG